MKIPNYIFSSAVRALDLATIVGRRELSHVPFHDWHTYDRLASARSLREVTEKQAPGSCIPDHAQCCRALSEQLNPGRKFAGMEVVKTDIPTPDQVKAALRKGPCLLLADNIAMEGSAYNEHHAVVLVGMKDDVQVVTIDKDDTVPHPGTVYLVDLRALLSQARLPEKENDDGHLVQIDAVLRRPTEKTGWGWLGWR